MGWFERQIEQRKNLDQELLEDSFYCITGAVMGQGSASRLSDDRIVTKRTIDEIVKYFHFKPVDIPSSITEREEQIDYCMRPHGILSRKIVLSDGWYHHAFGPILAYRTDNGEPVALFPDKVAGYYYTDRETRQRVKINKKTMDMLEPEALCFYKPLPQKKLKITDLILFMKQCITINDWVMVILSTLAVTLIGMIGPKLVKVLTGPALSDGSGRMLIGVAVFMIASTLANLMFSAVNGMMKARLTIKTSMYVESAMMMRLMSMSPNFFRKYSAGELATRSESVNVLCDLMIGVFLGTSLTSIASLLYIFQIFTFARGLVIPSLIIILVTVAFSMITVAVEVRISKKYMVLTAAGNGLSYSIISGIQKIKLSGAEKRFFARWLSRYSKGVELIYSPPMFIRINVVITTAIGLISTIVLYYLSITNGLDQSDYYAFSTAYGLVMGAFTALSNVALSIGKIRPTLEMAEPFLQSEPEVPDNREVVTELSGGIELDKVSFRYDKEMPFVLHDMTLRINPGEYVGVVGRTGCGKSTLIRLLLGFEKAEKGAVYYDGKDINRLDIGSLRRRIGTVLQSGGLFQGDIYSNIVISAPQLTMDEAWEAAEIAGIADDIREMPMGMNTVISEGGGGISGGQKQRIMIARAVAPKPKILIFDEATSALDNKTQKQVSDALDAMGCTRIVVAHRLSTIRHCDRIVVLDEGKIVENGTYEELIAQGGLFSKLVEQQRLDKED